MRVAECPEVLALSLLLRIPSVYEPGYFPQGQWVFCLGHRLHHLATGGAHINKDLCLFDEQRA